MSVVLIEQKLQHVWTWQTQTCSWTICCFLASYSTFLLCFILTNLSLSVLSRERICLYGWQIEVWESGLLHARQESLFNYFQVAKTEFNYCIDFSNSHVTSPPDFSTVFRNALSALFFFLTPLLMGETERDSVKRQQTDCEFLRLQAKQIQAAVSLLVLFAS